MNAPQTQDITIGQLGLTLPASLGARKHAVMGLLRGELLRLRWPAGELGLLQPAPTEFRAGQSNITIARNIANAIHAAAWQAANHERSAEGA